MRNSSLTNISPWSTGSWAVRPEEIKLLKPEGYKRKRDHFDMSTFTKSRPLVPFGRSQYKETIIIIMGILTGFSIGAFIFLALL